MSPVVRTWNFLLPGTGQHQLRVENIGSAGQHVHIDGAPVAAPEGTLVFTGPGGCLLELRNAGHGWSLLVDGLAVEEYDPQSKELRNVRNMADGSYTIATHFEADGLVSPLRKYRFTAHGRPHEVVIGHSSEATRGSSTGSWQVVLDGRIVHHWCKQMSSRRNESTFSVDVGGGRQVEARAVISWRMPSMTWGFDVTVNGIVVPASWMPRPGDFAIAPPEVVSPDVVQWWKFTLPGLGMHQVRAKNLGSDGEEVLIDGAPVAAPPGTTSFTGPGGSFLELRRDTGGSGWALLVDGSPVPCVAPEPAQKPAALWWKFSPPDMGTHHVRVVNVGDQNQEIFLDGAPLLAPPGTTCFTGPGGGLLEIVRIGDGWGLNFDGQAVPSYDPNTDTDDPPLEWNFQVAATGAHHLRVVNIGRAGQEVILDGTRLTAPEGTLSFTGPGGVLLELAQKEGTWVLRVEGMELAPGGDSALPDSSPEQALWMMNMPDGNSHRVLVTRLGRSDQQVFIDDVPVPAPPGTMSFTGPAAKLLELRKSGTNWVLYVDGVGVEAFNASSRSAAAVASIDEGGREVVPGAALPQGVSYDEESRTYQANVRIRGKFLFLGNFDTVEDAHARYLEAKELHGV